MFKNRYPIKYVKGEMKMETFKVEIEGIDGEIRQYMVSCEDLLKMIEKNVNYRLILEG